MHGFAAHSRAAVLLLATATLHAGAPPVREYLDEKTAATITVVRSPLLFAGERGELAVNARDYLTLGAIEVNRMGERRLYWFAWWWSTIDPNKRASGSDAGEFVLLADGRPVPLKAVPGEPRDLGVGMAPLRRPARFAQARVYATSREALDYVAHARELSVTPAGSEPGTAFMLWRDTRSALRDFLRTVAAP